MDQKVCAIIITISIAEDLYCESSHYMEKNKTEMFKFPFLLLCSWTDGTEVQDTNFATLNAAVWVPRAMAYIE